MENRLYFRSMSIFTSVYRRDRREYIESTYLLLRVLADILNELNNNNFGDGLVNNAKDLWIYYRF